MKKIEKVTFPALFGIEQSQRMAVDAVEAAVQALEIFGERGETLVQLARYLLGREA